MAVHRQQSKGGNMSNEMAEALRSIGQEIVQDEAGQLVLKD